MISTIFSRVLQWEWCGSSPALRHKVWGVQFFWFKGLKTIYVYRPRWRVTINFKFLAMASSKDTYQLLFVSYLLASGHDLITRRSVNRPATKGSHTFRAADSDPTGGPPLQQTANDKLSIWQGHGDSHFHVGPHTWYRAAGLETSDSKSCCQYYDALRNLSGASSR